MQRQKPANVTLRTRETTTLSAHRDKLGILAAGTVPTAEGRPLDAMLRINTGRRGTRPPNPTVIKIDNDMVDKASFCRLNDGLWLDDTIINFFCKQVLQTFNPDAHWYSTHFFRNLLHHDSPSPRYEFADVAGWDERIEGGVSPKSSSMSQSTKGVITGCSSVRAWKRRRSSYGTPWGSTQQIVTGWRRYEDTSTTSGRRRLLMISPLHPGGQPGPSTTDPAPARSKITRMTVVSSHWSQCPSSHRGSTSTAPRTTNN